MAYTAYKTWTVGEIMTAANMNAQVRDNGLLGPEALATADGEVWIATGANAGEMVAILNSSNFLKHEYGGLEFDANTVTTNDGIGGASSGVLEIKVPVTQAEAEAGTNTRFSLWSSQRVKQAIDALALTADLVTDLTPQLGGDLDFNGSDASGIGHLGFLATQDPSAGANDLDDYEENTFTPALADDSLDGSGESQTYAAQVGHYTKIGREVFFQLRLIVTSLGSLTTTQQARIVGMPFTSANVSNLLQSVAVGEASAMSLDNAGEAVSGHLSINANDIALRAWDTTAGQSILKVSEFSATGDIAIGGHYRV